MIAPARPKRVLHALWLLWLTIAARLVALALWAGYWHPHMPLHWLLALPVLTAIPVAVLAYAVGQGRNWARILYVVFLVQSLLPTIAFFLQASSQPAVAAFVALVLITDICAAIMLFTPTSNAWFRATTEAERRAAALRSLKAVPEVPDMKPALDRSWARSWPGVGANDGGEALRDTLLARWSEPHRHYHTLQHLHECLALFDGVQALPQHPHEVEVALWFHDAIYDPRASDNELRSAQWAQQALADAGVLTVVAERVFALVMATCHEAVPADLDAQVLVDIDLAVLGAEPDRFAEYERQVRAEYAHVPGWLFRWRRRAILRSFLARANIYSTPHFRARFETQARANLARAT